jgi:hypothetical protein
VPSGLNGARPQGGEQAPSGRTRRGQREGTAQPAEEPPGKASRQEAVKQGAQQQETERLREQKAPNAQQQEAEQLRERGLAARWKEQELHEEGRRQEFLRRTWEASGGSRDLWGVRETTKAREEVSWRISQSGPLRAEERRQESEGRLEERARQHAGEPREQLLEAHWQAEARHEGRRKREWCRQLWAEEGRSPEGWAARERSEEQDAERWRMQQEAERRTGQHPNVMQQGAGQLPMARPKAVQQGGGIRLAIERWGMRRGLQEPAHLPPAPPQRPGRAPKPEY